MLASGVYVLVSSDFLGIGFLYLASFLTGMGGAYAACINSSASYIAQVMILIANW